MDRADERDIEEVRRLLGKEADEGYNKDMKPFDLMSKNQSFTVGKDIRVHAKKIYGTDYDFWVQDDTKKIRDTMYVVENNLKLIFDYEVPTVVFLKKSKLSGWAGYSYKQDILFISDELHSEESAKNLLLDNYFASVDLKDILIHELTHKKHWDTAKKFYKNNKKRYNNLEEAKKSMDSPIISFIKEQQAIDYNYLYKISEYADISGLQNRYNEVIAESITAGNRLDDQSLIMKIKEAFKWK